MKRTRRRLPLDIRIGRLFSPTFEVPEYVWRNLSSLLKNETRLIELTKDLERVVNDAILNGTTDGEFFDAWEAMVVLCRAVKGATDGQIET